MKPAKRLDGIGISLIRQINALATAESLNLGIGEPNIEPDETLRAMAARAASTGSWHYSPNPGNLSLRKKIAAKKDFNPRTEVCVTAGTEEGLYSIFQAYVNDGDEVLVPNPGFTSYPTLAKLCGGTPVAYGIDPPDWKLDARSVLSKITSKTKLIVVNSPSNPLGSIIDRQTLETIAS
ncbi:MAG TPA: pyridoxal phosphate-dependent aminotransferase, partial [Thermoanaerobaculia bacterium]|nr:pyridoxal phosphate-dependent aminotransferase [Thermoanaerobaculia bacterium]